MSAGVAAILGSDKPAASVRSPQSSLSEAVSVSALPRMFGTCSRAFVGLSEG